MHKKEVLLTLARAAIAHELGIDYGVDMETLKQENPWLKKQGAAFVTLNRKADGTLRGCIGSIVAHQPLFDDIVNNAKSAAFADPRFKPLRVDEFNEIKIEISLLTPPQPLVYESIESLKEKVRPGVDGVILKEGNYQATFLPQVWEQLPSFELFFTHLCQKAGLPQGCLKSHPQIFLYQVEEYAE